MVETVALNDVAKELKTTSKKVIVAIKNGTLPIGMVAEPENEQEKHVVKIFKTRWEMYKKGEL